MVEIPSQKRRVLLNTNPVKRQYDITSLRFIGRRPIYQTRKIEVTSIPNLFHSILPYYRLIYNRMVSLLDISHDKGVLTIEIINLLSDRIVMELSNDLNLP